MKTTNLLTNISIFFSEEKNKVIINCFLYKPTFFKRIKYALKYLFFNENISEKIELNPKNNDHLIDLFLKNKNNKE
jgi:hypothetical protein